MDKDKKPKHTGTTSNPQSANAPEMEELLRRLQPEMSRSRPGADAIAAALEAAQRFAAETDAEDAASDTARDLARDIEADLSAGSGAVICAVCGYHNRGNNKFCGMCGLPVTTSSGSAIAIPTEIEPRHSRTALPPNPYADLEPEPRPMGNRGSAVETHHYHHHYHHHYFPGGQDGMGSPGMGQGAAGQGMLPRSADSGRDPDKMRPTAAQRGDMSRAEAAVRRITHEWVLACNTKHLDDLLDLYLPDALLLRSNYPPVRGAAAVREFFFAALDAGLGEVEVEPLRVDVIGDMAYEAGRCKALVPSATGKRREERGKYLWVCVRQASGEWKLAADCWSSDLTFTNLESDVPPSAGVKSSVPRKGS